MDKIVKRQIDKFCWQQMFNNSEGKTSGMLFVCIYGCFVAVTGFLMVCNLIFGAAVYAVIFKQNMSDLLRADIQATLQNIILQCGALFALAGSGLGIRRFTNDKPIVKEESPEV